MRKFRDITDNALRIVAVDESYLDTGKVYIKVQVVGTARVFSRTVSDLYQRAWLDQFSREDIAQIAALYAAEQTQQLDIIKRFPKNSTANKSGVVLVAMLFTAFLILSNLTAAKIAKIGFLNFPAGLIFIPLTYVFDDILTEVYGFKASRRVIWVALLANTIIFLGTWLTTFLPSAPYWHFQEAYATVYHETPRIFIASMVSYVFGEFTNSVILAKFKIMTQGEHLWLRIMASTACGVGIDTVFFTHIAFINTIPYHAIWQIILTMYGCKVIYEICAMPLTYRLCSYLKARDNVDHYDYQTHFNPFSLEV